MSGNDLTIEKVVATVRERGPMRNLELRAVLGADDERAFDRLLQKARKQGLICCEGSQWSVTDRESPDAQIARLTRERDQAAAELSATVAAGMADHARIESERARLQRQIDAMLSDMEPLAAERDALKAQLAALQAEHDSAAQATEESKRLADALCEPDAAGRSLPELLRDACAAICGAGGGPLADCLHLKAEEIEAVLAEVKP